ncbi:hypothetical protein EDD85DRAFT_942836 [Armillaria nabsnona]|nr:hypothetical protein EDD85DRAFT_942836 [Armillaria nabsnona]
MCGKHSVISTNLVGSHANLGRRVRESAARIRFGPKSGLLRLAISSGCKVLACPLAKRNPGPLDALGPTPDPMSISPSNHSRIEKKTGWFTCGLPLLYPDHTSQNHTASSVHLSPLRTPEAQYSQVVENAAISHCRLQGENLWASYSYYPMFGAREAYEIGDDIVVAYTSGKILFLPDPSGTNDHELKASPEIRPVLVQAILQGGIVALSHCVDRLHENLKARAGNKQHGNPGTTGIELTKKANANAAM